MSDLALDEPTLFTLFREQLYTICIEKMRSGEEAEYFAGLLWRYKKWACRHDVC
jgi:hypothetical protein